MQGFGIRGECLGFRFQGFGLRVQGVVTKSSAWIAPPDPPDEQMKKCESTTASVEPTTIIAASDEVLLRFSNLQELIEADDPEYRYSRPCGRCTG